MTIVAVVPAKAGTDNPRLWNIGPRLCAEDGGESVQGQRCEGVRERLKHLFVHRNVIVPEFGVLVWLELRR